MHRIIHPFEAEKKKTKEKKRRTKLIKIGWKNQIESWNVHLPLKNLSPNIFPANMKSKEKKKQNRKFNEPMEMHFYRDSWTFGRRRDNATALGGTVRKSIFFETSTQPEMQNSLIVIPSPVLDLDNQSTKILELRKKKKRKGGEKGNSVSNEISSLSGELRRYDGSVCFVAIIGLKIAPLPPSLPPLFETFLVYARGMVLLTQFPATRFSVNRTGARVRNNSLLKPGALLTSFQSVFQFLQIGPFNVSM